MLEMRNIIKVFSHGNILRKRQTIIHGVNLSIAKGETLGIVGQSGAGKSTLGKLAVRLLEPTSGQLLFEGTDITHTKERGLRRLRSKMQIVFQHPQSSLHPKRKMVDLIKEPLRLHTLVEKSRENEAVEKILLRVGLNADILDRYPTEVSGGEIQRIVIARAIALQPRFIVLDEPTSMLDVLVQANILHLIMELKQKTNMSYMFISHDMRIIQKLCDRVAVMEQGKIIEQGPVPDVIASPRHPCTKRLMEMSGL